MVNRLFGAIEPPIISFTKQVVIEISAAVAASGGRGHTTRERPS